MSTRAVPNSATAWICSTCGTQQEPSPEPPARCAICEDERQYVGWDGQRWTTRRELARTHRIRFEEDDGIAALGLSPAFAIDQRALLVPMGSSNLLWECVSLLTDEALALVAARGGVACMAISHPHFYASMHDWSEALGGVPIYLHEADHQWVQRRSPYIRYWSGERLQLTEDIELIHLAGHFAGSTGLWWKTGPRRGGSLLPGDALQVAMDRRHTTFMYSYPNAIPLNPAVVRSLRDTVAPLSFADVFGYTWGRNIIGDAHRAVDRSFDRYLAAVGAQPR